YYFKKHKRTFDYDFYRSGYNISCYIRELDGFFTYLLGKQHLSDETDIISKGFLHSALSRTNKSTYGNHVRNVGRFLKYLNYRYMNLTYQDMSPTEAHQINQANHRDLADRIKVFNRVEVSRNEPAHRYKSITSQQSVELTNMLIPSTPEFTDIETGELIMAVVNPQNPFD
ncbi:site-specific integrase, partial [Escherichia coli]